MLIKKHVFHSNPFDREKLLFFCRYTFIIKIGKNLQISHADNGPKRINALNKCLFEETTLDLAHTIRILSSNKPPSNSYPLLQQATTQNDILSHAFK